jgi:hypothetical protein
MVLVTVFSLLLVGWAVRAWRIAHATVTVSEQAKR